MAYGPPAEPVQRGTFSLSRDIGADYSVGRDACASRLAAIRQQHTEIACDIESEGLGILGLNIKAVIFAVKTEAVVLDPRDPAQAAMVREVFADTSLWYTFHNSTFDVPFLYRRGLMNREACNRIRDTLIYERLASPDELARKTLGSLAAKYLGMAGEDVLVAAFKRLGMTKSEGFRVFDLDRPIYLQGAAIDGIVTARVLDKVRQAAYDQLTKDHPFSDNGVAGKEAWDLVEREQRINRANLRARGTKGFRVDFEFLDNYRTTTSAEMHAQEQELVQYGITPGHSGSLTTWLEANDALPADYPRTAKTDRPSGTAKDLERLSHPLAATFVKHKQTAKILNDYLVKVADLASEDGLIYPTLNLLGATTGRASMGSPPLHQYPAAARGILLADPGDRMTSIDWSQIEPVLIANIAGDLPVVEGYERGDSDMYTDIAKLAKVPRKVAKVIILAQLYGEGLRKLSDDLRVSLDEAERLRDAVFGGMPRVSQMTQRLRNIAKQYHKVFTVSGRIVPVGWGTWNGVRSIQTHKGINYFVQGGAYDVLAETYIRCEEAGLGDAIYLTMHDELVVSTDAAEDVRRIMETPPERLCRLAKRTPVLRTDMNHMGDRWQYV